MIRQKAPLPTSSTCGIGQLRVPSREGNHLLDDIDSLWTQTATPLGQEQPSTGDGFPAQESSGLTDGK